MFKIADKTFNSRLMVGTGKYSTPKIMKDSILSSKSEIVTVSLRRMDFSKDKSANILSYLPKGIQLLPNTSGARDEKEAIHLARLARAATGSDWIKVEVIKDQKYLLPDPIATLRACETLVKEGFVVLPYMNADPSLAKRLENIGVATVMPLGSPIGTNRGIETLEMIKIIIEQSNIPVIVDAGIGKPSDATLAMELGADGVLINTAMAVSNNPIEISKSFELAVRSGRMAFEAGLPRRLKYASASSPTENLLTGFLQSEKGL